MPYRNKLGGFTLVECVIYIGVLSLILTATNALYFSVSDISESARQAIEDEQLGSYLIQMTEIAWHTGQQFEISSSTYPSIDFLSSTTTASEREVSFSINNSNFFIYESAH